jgi:hypothetical protein
VIEATAFSKIQIPVTIYQSERRKPAAGRASRLSTRIVLKQRILTCIRKRKVKCDEGRPACRCCISTGRVCDGYGIWGGGGNRYEQRYSSATAVVAPQRKPNEAKVQIPRALPVGQVSHATQDERAYFDFFQNCTATRLLVVLAPSFRKSILLQTSASEPAVLHALLALAACHKRKETDGFSRHQSRVSLDKQEQFVLQQYSKAIHHLQPYELPISTSL